MVNAGIQFGAISKDRKLLKKYESQKKIDTADSKAIDELANIGLIDKKININTFEITAQTSRLGKELLKSLPPIAG